MKKLEFLRWIGVSAAGCLMGVGAYADGAPVRAVDSVAMTVGNLDVSRAFYENVLKFQFLSETEVSGEAYEHLYGVFGLRLHIVTLKLGDERLQLEQFIAPQGRPFPVDSRSNDRWFQHVAIIVSDMDRAFAWLREHNVHLSPRAAPKCFLNRTNRLPAFQPSIFGIPTGTTWKCCIFRTTRETPNGMSILADCFSVSIIPPLSSLTRNPA